MIQNVTSKIDEIENSFALHKHFFSLRKLIENRIK